MTTGFFPSANEPALPLEVRGPDGARSFDAIIDTGFNGALTLPPDWIPPLGLPQAGQEPVTLADGREVTAALYDAYLILDDEAYSITVAEAPTKRLSSAPISCGASRCSSNSGPGAPLTSSRSLHPPPEHVAALPPSGPEQLNDPCDDVLPPGLFEHTRCPFEQLKTGRLIWL